MATRSNKQGLASDISNYEKSDASSALMGNSLAAGTQAAELLSADSSSRRYRESLREAEVEAENGSEFEYLATTALRDYIKEQGLENQLSSETKAKIKKFDEMVEKGQMSSSTGGLEPRGFDRVGNNFSVFARDVADSIKLDTRHFMNKSLSKLTGYKEDEAKGYDPVESLGRFYLGKRVALVATRDDGVKAVIMDESRGESKFKKGDIVGNADSGPNNRGWTGSVVKVINFTPQDARLVMDKYKAEWFTDPYPTVRDGKTTLDTTD